jgi:hypothetical protein
MQSNFLESTGTVMRKFEKIKKCAFLVYLHNTIEYVPSPYLITVRIPRRSPTTLQILIKEMRNFRNKMRRSLHP